MDYAGRHTTEKLKLPENISVLPLSPYSSKLNPTEHVWDYIRNKKNSIIIHLNLLMLLMINWISFMRFKP